MAAGRGRQDLRRFSGEPPRDEPAQPPEKLAGLLREPDPRLPEVRAAFLVAWLAAVSGDGGTSSAATREGDPNFQSGPRLDRDLIFIISSLTIYIYTPYLDRD